MLALLVNGATVACDLPLEAVGAPCPKLGEFARDATHVLKCVEGTVAVAPADPTSTAPVDDDAPPVAPPAVWEALITVELADMARARMAWKQPTPASPVPVERSSDCPISRRYALAG